jgi:hypothetical protein
MTSHTRSRRASADEDRRGGPRLALKPNGPVTGQVDGAWWPRSRDLAAELPDLIAGLADRIGSVERLSYNLTAWTAPPRKVTVNGSLVRLGGFRSQHPDTLDVLGAKQRLTLLVVPPAASPKAAQRVLQQAGRVGDTGGIEELLAPCAPSPRKARTPHAGATAGS